MVTLPDEYQNNFITSNDKCPSSKFEIYSEPNIKYLGNIISILEDSSIQITVNKN